MKKLTLPRFPYTTFSKGVNFLAAACAIAAFVDYLAESSDRRLAYDATITHLFLACTEFYETKRDATIQDLTVDLRSQLNAIDSRLSAASEQSLREIVEESISPYNANRPVDMIDMRCNDYFRGSTRGKTASIKALEKRNKEPDKNEE